MYEFRNFEDEASDQQGALRDQANALTKKVRDLADHLDVSAYGPTRDHPEIQAIDALLGQVQELKRVFGRHRELCQSTDAECQPAKQTAPEVTPVPKKRKPVDRKARYRESL